MKIKTSDLEGIPLDWAVLQILEPSERYEGIIRDGVLELWHSSEIGTHNPTLDRDNKPRFIRARDGVPVFLFGCPANVQEWSVVGPIMDDFNIDVDFVEEGRFNASLGRAQLVPGLGCGSYSYCGEYGPSRIVAVLRCFVTLKMGPVVEVPDELTN